MSFFIDVGMFHFKFGLPVAGEVIETVARDSVRHCEALPAAIVTSPGQVSDEVARFRLNFLCEELAEFMDAMGFAAPASTIKNVGKAVKAWKDRADPLNVREQDLEKAADALADLVYVALGTAHMMGLPFEAVWAEVQRANMTKVRATGDDDPRSKRGSSLDVVKPEGWKAPDHGPAIEAAMTRRWEK